LVTRGILFFRLPLAPLPKSAAMEVAGPLCLHSQAG
jgi:hypothetical protein